VLLPDLLEKPLRVTADRGSRSEAEQSEFL
jgi:hypothetical protein